MHVMAVGGGSSQDWIVGSSMRIIHRSYPQEVGFPQTVYCRGSLSGKKKLATDSGRAGEHCVWTLSSCCPLLVLLLVCSLAVAASRSPDLVLLLSVVYLFSSSCLLLVLLVSPSAINWSNARKQSHTCKPCEAPSEPKRQQASAVRPQYTACQQSVDFKA